MERPYSMDVESVFIDIDGTLMDSHGNISNDSIRSIKKLIDNNVKVVINSGRILPEIKTVLKKLGMVLPVIGCNGGFVTDDKCRDIKALNIIPKQALTECMEICCEQKAVKCCSTACSFYADVSFRPLMDTLREKYSELARDSLMAQPIYVSDEEWPELVMKENFLKFNAYAESPELQSKLKSKLSGVSGISLTLYGKYSLEYGASGINKGNSMLTYLHMHGLSPHTSVAIGDGNNDIQMVKAAGMGIAMGNADGKLKQQADFVTDTIDENGLSQVLEKLQ